MARVHDDDRAFDALSRRYGCEEAARLSRKEKSAVLRRFATREQTGAVFAALCAQGMRTMQREAMARHERDRAISTRAAARKAAKRHVADLLASLAAPVSRIAGQAEHLHVLAGLPADLFFRTPEWRRTRWEALNLYGRRCISCGAVPADEARLTATHVAGRLVRPDLAFDLANLRILCADCHIGRRALNRPGETP